MVLLLLLFLLLRIDVSSSSSSSLLSSVVAQAPVSAGTTLIAARYGSGDEWGIIIGADSRMSRSNYVANRHARKLTVISPNLVLGRSGSAAVTQQLTEELTLELERFERSRSPESPSFSRVSTAAHILQRLAFGTKDSTTASLLCVGWDRYRGLQMYAIPKGGTLVPSSTFVLSGSGSSFIYGWCDMAWRPGMNRNECIQFVGQAIELAIGRDSLSGADKRLIDITTPNLKRE